MLRIRPSARPLAVACPSSALEPETPIRSVGYPARRGSAVHDGIVAVERDAEDRATVAARVATKYRVDADDVSNLLEVTHNALTTLRDALPEGRWYWEHELPEWQGVGGRLDLGVVGHNGDIAVIDWKSGWLETDAYEQLIDYASRLLAWVEHHLPDIKIGSVRGVAVNLEHGTWIVHEFTPDDMMAFIERDQSIRRRAGHEYNPGIPHCSYCHARAECKALAAMNESTALALGSDVAPLTAGDLGAFYPRVKLLERAIERYRTLLRLAVEQEGELPTGDGRKLLMKDYRVDDIDPKRAWFILQDAGFSDDDIAATLRISKSALQAVAGERYDAAVEAGTAAKRQKGKHQKAIVEALRDGGAITETTQRRIAAVKEGA